MKSLIRIVSFLCLFFASTALPASTGQAQVTNPIYLPHMFKDAESKPHSTATAAAAFTPTATETPTAPIVPIATPLATSTFATSTPVASVSATLAPTTTNLATAVPTPSRTETPIPAPPGYILSNSSWMTDTVGHLHIFGEIKNAGATSMQFAYITATLFANDGQRLSMQTVMGQRRAIGPGEISCFHVDVMYPDNFAYYTLGGAYTAGGEIVAPPTAVEGPLFGFNILGYPLIKGEVRNDSSIQYAALAIEGVLYNDGQVIGCSSDSRSYTENTALSPGQSFPYLVEFLPPPSLPIGAFAIRINAYP